MKYDKDKEVKIGDVHQAFIKYIGYRTLTLSERLLIEDLWEEVRSVLNEGGDVE